jgi:hypothetical protein
MFKRNSKAPLILYSELETCCDRISSIHQAFRDQRNCQNFQLIGVSGLGKSTLLKNYCMEHPQRREGSGVVVPVGYFAVPSSPTPKSLMRAVVRMFGGPEVGTADDLMNRGAQYVNHTEMEVLFADEAHHLIDRGRLKTHAHLGDCLKEFEDLIECPICLVGAPRVLQILETNNQLRNRGGETLSLHPFSYDAGASDLASFVVNVTSGTSLEKHAAFLTAPDVLTRLQYATDGVPACVVEYLHSLRVLIDTGSPMELHTLNQAWRRAGTGKLPLSRRPFCKEFNFERLSGIDEPFYPSPFDGDNHAPYA